MGGRAPALARAPGAVGVRRRRSGAFSEPPSRSWRCRSAAVDGCIAATLYVASDRIAQQASQRGKGAGYDAGRGLRYLAFGLLDGSVSHVWFRELDAAVDGLHVAEGKLAVAAKVAADFALFTPAWCAAFLLTMAVRTSGAKSRAEPDRSLSLAISLSLSRPMAGWLTRVVFRRLRVQVLRGSGAPLGRVRREWAALYRGNVLAWLPANVVIYGAVPVGARVAAFALYNLAYTAALSFWAEGELAEGEPESGSGSGSGWG